VRVASGPDPPGSNRCVFERRRTPVPRVCLSATLATPASSGSTDTSWLCQGRLPPRLGTSRDRLPPASPPRCDGTEAKVSHLHSINKRLTAHRRKDAHPGTAHEARASRGNGWLCGACPRADVRSLQAVLGRPPGWVDNTDVRIEFTLDCSDLDRLASFWEAAADLVIGGEIEGRYVTLSGHGITLNLQGVAEPKTVKNRMHLDLLVDDLELAVRRLESLGATRLTATA